MEKTIGVNLKNQKETEQKYEKTFNTEDEKAKLYDKMKFIKMKNDLRDQMGVIVTQAD